MKFVRIEVELEPEEAWEFAQFLKRVSFDTFRIHTELSRNAEQAHLMSAAGAKIREALAAAGYNPR